MIHLTIQQLSSHLDGESSESSSTLAREHLATCEACAATLARLEKQEDALAGALMSDPDGAFFERFQRELVAKLQGAGRKPPPPQPSEPAPHSAERQETVAHTPVPKPAPSAARPPHAEPATTEFHMHRFQPLDEHAPPKARSVRHAAKVRETGAPFSWAAAILIIALAGSVGAFIFGKELVATWLGTPGASARASRAASEVPSTPDYMASDTQSPLGTPEVTYTVPVPAEEDDPKIPKRARHDENDGLDPIVDSPEDGALRDSLNAYEAVASEWERSLPLLHGEEYQTARMRLAEARYRVWQLDPTEERGSSAAGAIRAYLVGAAPGPERERATRWLSEIHKASY